MYEELRNILEQSNNVVFFGGAGVSTESGIPDFRSKDGLYNQHDVKFGKYEPEYLLSKDCLNYEPKVFYEFCRQKLDTRGIEPNVTHRVLAKLESLGKVKAVVTQNIDGLHQKAGSKCVYEIHGSTAQNCCQKCRKIFKSDVIFKSDGVPHCACGGMIRPNIVLYGESLPKDAVFNAIDAIKEADCLVVGGTSLSVYPAAGLLKYFKGKHLVVINKEELNVSGALVITDSLGKVFSEIEKWF